MFKRIMFLALLCATAAHAATFTATGVQTPWGLYAGSGTGSKLGNYATFDECVKAAAAVATKAGTATCKPPSSNVTVTAAPVYTWTKIADEGAAFTVGTGQLVRYGYGTAWVQKTLTGAGQCTNAFFGSDPISGTTKQCQLAAGTGTAAPAPTPAPAPVPAPVAGVAWTGITAAMWSEINAQRAAFGDTNDCQARVNAIPTQGVIIKPGDDINAALKTNSPIFMTAGTYKLTSTISLDAGKKLIGMAGQTVIIDASAVEQAVWLRSGAVLANVLIRDAIDVGVNFYDAATDSGSSNALLYQVSVGRTGLSAAANANGVGFGVWYGAANNCLVSTEAFDTWNEDATGSGNATGAGGNADGYRNSYSAHHNTFIDSHSYRSGDDGFDMWEGGVAFMYFSTSRDNGKTTGKTITGDGNGVKLGIGAVAHKLYKVQALSNKANGFDINGNTVQPVLVQSTSSGNGSQNYAGVTP